MLRVEFVHPMSVELHLCSIELVGLWKTTPLVKAYSAILQNDVDKTAIVNLHAIFAVYYAFIAFTVLYHAYHTCWLCKEAYLLHILEESPCVMYSLHVIWTERTVYTRRHVTQKGSVMCATCGLHYTQGACYSLKRTVFWKPADRALE